MSHAMDRFVAVIPAGGVGSRLWPLSRAASPKFLHDVMGNGSSLLADTWDRLVALCAPERILVVTGAAHGEAVREQLPELLDKNVVLESEGRDSTAAIGLAAAILERRMPGAIIGSFAADHLIGNLSRFRSAVREAVRAADAGMIATIGIQPIEPSTAFGYIRAGAPLEIKGAPSARSVEAFVEKPAASTARRYLASGEYLWNAGMFIARAERLLEELAENRPELAAGINEIADAWDTDAREEVVARVWPTLEKIAIDYTVAEPAAAKGALAVIPGFFQWDDVGDFASVSRLRQIEQAAAGESPHLVVMGDEERVIGHEATGLVLSKTDRVIAVAGIQDVVIVDTDDAILVTTRQKAQQVKQLVGKLKESPHPEVL
ncbi:mannose-1-phosphate guanylyltransferase [Pseudoclavibacter alba]|uniref:Sugar phosphate nucleotidyltransferase n=1 Tax=Pseudoclavibacter albus TaxID=272241 RepID=A0ABT2HU14_9MICO|nr:mannose-1-phosphate guanylyltransferase [Pseudoclavibacter alba]MBN6778335.1 mannose-1-phosphate guanylyltransferase [Pseudoclavibacter alba]MCT2041810.1 sugar phosphate nucleotidyltransferase [Pseudoclavibacter alba]